MAVLVFVETHEGKLRKSAREVASYAAKVAEQQGTEAVAIAGGSASHEELATLGQHGVTKVLHAHDARLDNFDSKAFTKVVAAAVEKTGANTIILSHSFSGKALTARLSARLKAGAVTGVLDLPAADGSVKKSVFSGKGFAHYAFKTDKKIISLNANSYPVAKGSGSAAVEDLGISLTDADFPVKVIKVESEGAGIPLPEAELVVSAGRGLKGPENWGMIEDLAKTLGAATACSRAVSDVHWRPHHEHVGQTGLTVSPNLYIAVAISGAIQHLAGVSSSKVIVVINNDPEAPFFKAADYGIVGDAFQVVPKLNEAFKKYFASHN
ncbi:MAG: electron transfer flavoprotein subunit alpha/FixB family protein [Chitinophagales bacterium]|nr:electron transfer flavoprotein subunit alpha/FixB family protein [Chitinophagales bacterium]